MSGSHIRRLGDAIEIRHGYAFDGRYFCDKGPYRLLTPGNFAEAGGFVDRGDKQKHYDGPVPPDFVLQPGALLIAMTEQGEGLLGSSALVPASGKPCLHNQRLGLVRPLPGANVDPRFLYYLFNTTSVRRQIRATATGVKVRHTAPSRIAAVLAYLPELSTQGRIASILGAYDDLIEVNRRRIALLEDMGRRLFEEWFVQFRFPGHDGAERGGDGLPVGWRYARLGEVAENFDRFRKPLSKPEREAMRGSYPYYGAAKVFAYVNQYLFDGEYLLIAEDGTVITNEGWPVLQLAHGRFWVNNHAHVLRGKGIVSTTYLLLALERYPVHAHITGAAQPKITQANLNRIPILVASDAVMTGFQHLVDPLIQQNIVLEQTNERLSHARDLLLPRLISGGLPVSSAERELESIA